MKKIKVKLKGHDHIFEFNVPSHYPNTIKITKPILDGDENAQLLDMILLDMIRDIIQSHFDIAIKNEKRSKMLKKMLK